MLSILIHMYIKEYHIARGNVWRVESLENLVNCLVIRQSKTIQIST